MKFSEWLNLHEVLATPIYVIDVVPNDDKTVSLRFVTDDQQQIGTSSPVRKLNNMNIEKDGYMVWQVQTDNSTYVAKMDKGVAKKLASVFYNRFTT